MLKRSQPIPLYYQLELQLREKIESGHWKPGDRLPPEIELARSYGVSRITVQQALERLGDEGLIERHRGRGTFVLAGASSLAKIERDPGRLFAFEEDILRQGFEPTVRILAIEEGPAESHIARLLRLPPGASIMRVRRIGNAAGEPLWIESRYFPVSIGHAIQDCDLTTPAISRLIEEHCKQHIASAHVRIEATAATANQAHHLEIVPRAPVLLNEFVFSDQEHHPVQAVRAFFRADRYAFSFTVGPNPADPVVADHGIVGVGYPKLTLLAEMRDATNGVQPQKGTS